MKKLMISVMVAFLCVMVWRPCIVQADDTGNITKYAELIQMSKDGYYAINPDTDFGWPSGNVAVTLQGAEIDLMKDWTIPANVTINTSTDTNTGGYSNACTITIKGTWNQNSSRSFYNTNYVVEAGGKIVINKDCTMPDSSEDLKNTMVVQNGGSLVLNDWMVVAGKLDLKKGSSVIKVENSGCLHLCGGILTGENVSVDVPVYINDGYTSSDETAVLSGTLTLNKGLISYPDTNVNITGNVTLSDLDGYDDGGKVTVKKGAKLIYTGDFDENDNLVIDAGGTLRGPESPKGIFVREGAKIVLNGTIEVPWYLKVLTTKSTITGSGTISLGEEGSLTNGRNGIADTIKITGRNAGNYQAGTSEPSQTPLAAAVKNGDIVTAGGTKYKVLSTTSKTLQYTKPVTATAAVTIPNTVKVSGTIYKVTQIAPNAFKNNKKLTKVVINGNITSIGKNAFYGCTKLKNITIKSSKITSVGGKALNKVNAKAVIKVPKKQKKLYQTLFKKAGLPKTAKVK